MKTEIIIGQKEINQKTESFLRSLWQSIDKAKRRWFIRVSKFLRVLKSGELQDKSNFPLTVSSVSESFFSSFLIWHFVVSRLKVINELQSYFISIIYLKPEAEFKFKATREVFTHCDDATTVSGP